MDSLSKVGQELRAAALGSPARVVVLKTRTKFIYGAINGHPQAYNMPQTREPAASPLAAGWKEAAEERERGASSGLFENFWNN